MQQLYSLMLKAKYLAKNKVEKILDNLEEELASAKEAAKKELESLKEEVSGSLSNIENADLSVTGSIATNAAAFATGYAANASANFLNKITPQLEGCPPRTPEKAIELREEYPQIRGAYHMNKKHWNTIVCDGSVNKKLIESWIDDSYNLVVSGLTKKLKTELDNL